MSVSADKPSGIATVRIGTTLVQGELVMSRCEPRRKPPLYHLEMVHIGTIEVFGDLHTGYLILPEEEPSNA